MKSICLKGGTVYDGSGAEGQPLDVLIRGDAIAALTPHADAPAHSDALTIDCSGCAVAPGFIDVHVHGGTAALHYSLAQSRVAAGVTTEVCGNCGGSPFPLDEQLRQKGQQLLSDTRVEIDWLDAPGYFARAAQAGSSINRAFLVGHGNLRAMTVGYDDRPATPAELDRMARLLAEGIEAGAYGMSSGLIYPPGCYGSTEELIQLANVVARYGGLYASHIRGEGVRLLESVGEFLSIVEGGGCRGILSHIKTAGPRNWHKIDALIEMLQSAHDRGVPFYCDRYPYLASWTSLDAILLPDWVFDGGREAELKRLRDPAMRERLRRAIVESHGEPDLADRVMIISVANTAFSDVIGMTLTDLARHRNSNPLDAALDLIADDETQTSAVHFSMSEENLKRLLALPFVMVASDSSVRDFEVKPGHSAHPRAFGTPIRFLADYVRDARLMTWGEGIRRLTGLPAEAMGWTRRGRIARDALADIVVFEPDRLADRATYVKPAVAPAGIRHVLVSGELVLRDGEHTGATPGRLIKRGEPE
ncbi:MAG: amidohydrolase family protein [Planctomycetes bacterium]|nr:amidohydrolase family protein [Planctomycetota bacterium]